MKQAAADLLCCAVLRAAQIIVLFISLKLLYPNHFHMTRGNHESKTMNNIYGFKGQRSSIHPLHSRAWSSECSAH